MADSNHIILTELEKLEKEARGWGDVRLGFVYKKAIKSIRAHNKPIKNGNEAMALDGIGKHIAKKIDDIFEMHEQQAEHMRLHPQMATLSSTLAAPMPTVSPLPASVNAWLTELGLPEYSQSFLNAGYDNLTVCSNLSEQDLDAMGGITKPGHRRTLIVAAAELKQRRLAAPAPASSAPASVLAGLHESSRDSAQRILSLPCMPALTRESADAVLPVVNETFITRNASPNVCMRGAQLVLERGVTRVSLMGLEVSATVLSASEEGATYTVSLSSDVRTRRVSRAQCACPYSPSGWCKHIVAVLFVILYHGDPSAAASALQPSMASGAPGSLAGDALCDSRNGRAFLAESAPGLLEDSETRTNAHLAALSTKRKDRSSQHVEDGETRPDDARKKTKKPRNSSAFGSSSSSASSPSSPSSSWLAPGTSASTSVSLPLSASTNGGPAKKRKAAAVEADPSRSSVSGSSVSGSTFLPASAFSSTSATLSSSSAAPSLLERFHLYLGEDLPSKTVSASPARPTTMPQRHLDRGLELPLIDLAETDGSEASRARPQPQLTSVPSTTSQARKQGGGVSLPTNAEDFAKIPREVEESEAVDPHDPAGGAVAAAAKNKKTKNQRAEAKQPKRYIPAYRSAPWAVLVALYAAASENETFPGYLTKAELVRLASTWTDTPLSADGANSTGNFYSGWSSVATLLNVRAQHVLTETPQAHPLTLSSA